MKKVISLLLLLGLLVGTTVVFSSCGKEAEPVGGGAQISVYLGDKITDFDPQANQTDEAALALIRLIYEPLFSVDPNGDIVCAGAKSYKFDESEGKLIIKLRETYWNDGATPVRASDYVYSWRRLISPSKEVNGKIEHNDNPAAALLFDVKNALKIKQGYSGLEFGVVDLDKETLEITFEEGFTSFKLFLYNLANVALSPLNQKLMSGRDSYWGMGLTTINSNGPFRITGLDSLEGGAFRLDRNRYYHRPSGSSAPADKYVIPAALKTLWNVYLMDEDTDEISVDEADDEYLTGLIDGLAEKTIFYIGEIPQALREQKKSSAVITDSLSTYSYAFNCSNPLFSNAKVRRVLSDVLDREYIAQLAVYGKAATGLIPSTVNAGTKANAWEATTKLSTTGLVPPAEGADRTAYESAVNEKKAEIAAIEGYAVGEFKLTYKDNTVNRMIAEYVQQVWQDLGYTVTLEPVCVKIRVEEEGDEMVKVYDDVVQMKFETGDYDVLALDYQMYSVNAFTVLSTFTTEMNGAGMAMSLYELAPNQKATLEILTGNTNQPTYYLVGNRMNYVSEKENEEDELGKFDLKMEAAYKEKDPAKRDTLLHEAEQILLSEMPVIPLLFNQRAYLASEDLSGLKVDRYGFVSFTDCKQKDYEKYLSAADIAAASTVAPEETGEPATEAETVAPAATEASGED